MMEPMDVPTAKQLERHESGLFREAKCAWTAWSEPVNGYYTGFLVKNGRQDCQVQERKCIICNKVEMRSC